MKSKLLEHILSIIVVGCALTALMVFLRSDVVPPPSASSPAHKYLAWQFLEFGDPLDRAIFADAYEVFHGNGQGMMQEIDDIRREQFTNELYKSGAEERGITVRKAVTLGVMYLKFIAIYLIVMALSYYGAQTVGLIRFIRLKQNRASYLERIAGVLSPGPTPLSLRVARVASLAAKGAGVLLLMFVVFSPAYVIAYSVRTEFNTNSIWFMIVLGVVSNGLLINYANRFFTLLVSESRKGHVETALVKNLHASYAWNAADGISRHAVFSLTKRFPFHVLQHIYLNARYQFHSTLKEHASFLITGLVIIEMALNIHGHLSYEMLKYVLYRQYDVVVLIVLGIFLLVKGTEIAVDLWTASEAKRISNEPRP